MSVNIVDAVWFAELTVTIGMYVPTGVEEFAENAIVPDGLVSVDEYFS
jgi:hypothetical protein